MQGLSILVYSDSPDLAASLAKEIERLSTVRRVERVTDAVRLEEATRPIQPDVLVLALGADPDGVLDAVAGLPDPRPALLVSGPLEESRCILRAMRLGAREYLPPQPGSEELATALAQVAREAPSDDADSGGRVVAVMGTKGGVGATFVACQLAAALQRVGGRTALVDLNLPLGDVALHLDLHPVYTLAHVAREGEGFDATYLRTVLQEHASGIQVLAASARVEEAELVRAEHVERLLGLLRVDFDWVVLDVSRSWGEPSLRALDLADQILLVTLSDIPTLTHTRQHLQVLERIGHAPRRVRILLNRASGAQAVTEPELAKFLDRKPDFRLANDFRLAGRCANEGKTLADLAPRSRLGTDTQALAKALYTWSDVEPPRPRGGMLRRVLRRS